MEILPEATLKLGLMLQSYDLARSGFSILVSEEALRVGGGKYFHSFPIKQKENKSSKKNVTRFGRAREDLDEDTQNIIQHAGQNFNSRIEKVLGELIDKDMCWMDTLPQFAKLLAFEERLTSMKTNAPNEPATLLFNTETAKLRRMIHLLRHFVRGRVVFCLIDNLSFQQAKNGTAHRDSERWVSQEGDSGEASFAHDYVYNTLSDHERMLNRGFWEMVRALEWTPNDYTNQIRDRMAKHNVHHDINSMIADAYGIEYVNMRTLEFHTTDINNFMAKTTRQGVLTSSAQLSPGGSNPAIPAQSSVDNLSDMLADLKAEIPNESLADWYSAELAVKRGMEPPKVEDPLNADTAWNLSMIDAMKRDFNEGPPRFSLPSFFTQVQRYLRNVCYGMLNKGENEFSMFCDTLLCLTDEEYKYLPLWAGGMDDGTGGVFEQDIPPAMKGPIGPGPSFHTGSTANSLAGSELDFEDGRSSVFGSHTMEGVQTSLGVEDGFTDHLDRRIVYSEEDFPMNDGAMDHGALPVHAHTAEQAIVGDSEVAPDRAYVQEIRDQTVSRSQIDSEDFFNTEDDEEGGDFDMESDSEGTLTGGE